MCYCSLTAGACCVGPILRNIAASLHARGGEGKQILAGEEKEVWPE